MQQVVFHHFTNVNVKYDFKLRNYPISEINGKMKDEIQREVDALCKLRFTREELKYLGSLPFISDDYIQFLRNFQLNADDVVMGFVYDKTENSGFRLFIQGSWLNTILFEVPILAIISEIFSRDRDKIPSVKIDNLYQKLEILGSIKVPFQSVEFGTRRRYSRLWQTRVVKAFSHYSEQFVGTSNVLLAKRFNIKPIGTMAHEYIEAMQALVRLEDSQKYALDIWAREYRGRLGIALSDTLGMDAFLRDFDLYFAKLFDGCRHDSGDPYVWCNKLINHYNQLGVNPKTKWAVFSDGLDIPSAIALNARFRNKINCSFGIGTNLTNDCGFKAPQIVIKMTRCNGNPVAKISDSRGKQMCEDNEYLRYLAKVFKIEKDEIYQ